MKINFLAALFGAFTVVVGALRAHYLKDKLPEDQLNSLATAVYFALFHIPLLFYVNTNPTLLQSALSSKIAVFMFTGILCFSGSIYILIFLKPYVPKFFGIVTPIGGLCLIVSWILLAVAFIKK